LGWARADGGWRMGCGSRTPPTSHFRHPTSNGVSPFWVGLTSKPLRAFCGWAATSPHLTASLSGGVTYRMSTPRVTLWRNTGIRDAQVINRRIGNDT
jgi:hypothetical protein